VRTTYVGRFPVRTAIAGDGAWVAKRRG
jgi:hypothetical protein